MFSRPVQRLVAGATVSSAPSIAAAAGPVGTAVPPVIAHSIGADLPVSTGGGRTDAARPNRTGLPDGLKHGIEALSGVAMDDVRVHRNSPQPGAIRALAYAQGSHIHLAPGQERHLPHEAWHVVQQKQSRVRATAQLKSGAAINDNAALEREADVMGARAATGAGFSIGALAARPAHATAAPVQRVLDETLIDELDAHPHTQALAQSARAYNVDKAQKGLKGKQKTNALARHVDLAGGLSDAALGWLDQRNVADVNVDPHAIRVKALLNDVQREHRQLVKTSLARPTALPPVAGFRTLAPPDKALVTNHWNSLVQGTGNVHIVPDPADANHPNAGQPDFTTFREETLANFARLLGSAPGRTLVDKVNTGPRDANGQRVKPVDIEAVSAAAGGETLASPKDPANALPSVELKAVDMSGLQGKQHAKRRKRLNKRHRTYPVVDLGQHATPEARAAAIYAARLANPGHKGINVGGKPYEWGTGSGATVKMARDIRDAEDHRQARSVDANDTEIPQPSFITMGHEFGHVGHFMDGAALNHYSLQPDLEPAVGGQGTNMAPWGDLEEFGNIKNAENELRAAHGLKPRYGHGNQERSQRDRLEQTLGPLDGIRKLLPPGTDPLIHHHINQASAANGNANVTGARTHASDAADWLSANLVQSFPTASTAQRLTIGNHLQSISALRPQAAATPTLARYHVGDPSRAIDGATLTTAGQDADAAHQLIKTLPKPDNRPLWRRWTGW